MNNSLLKPESCILSVRISLLPFSTSHSPTDHTRFLNYFGEPHARLERTFSVHGDAINPRTWLIKTISMFLFFAPEIHLSMLQRMWVDGILHKSVWEDAFKKINDEWTDITLLVSTFFESYFKFPLALVLKVLISQATVILTAAVSFLSISGITNNKNTLPYISSCISIVSTIGSIILGLLLKRQHQTKIRDTANDIVGFKLPRIIYVLSLIPAFIKSRRFFAGGITPPVGLKSWQFYTACHTLS